MTIHIQHSAPAIVPNLQAPVPSESIASESSSGDQGTLKQIQSRESSSKLHPNVILSLEEILLKLANHLSARVERIGNSLDSRSMTMQDLGNVERALAGIKEDGVPPYTAETFNIPVKLEYGSPAQGKDLWSVLVYYGIQKKEDAPPQTKPELEALIGTLSSKISSLSTLSNETITRMNLISGNRDNYLSQATELIMRELKLMLSILNQR
ncbi:MAG TPA: hypothetical protein VGN04_12270 [Herbaspirillum sp.]